ncbi:alpha/beta fold hydrolase, partial [Streptomyces eurythermus]
MSAFVLVSGPFTDGRIWNAVVGRLRRKGAGAYPVTLDMRPEADLETHVEDVVRLIDSLDVPRVVLVGHDYAIHPVLGAADLRPERVARVVHLDAGLPQHGDPANAGKNAKPGEPTVACGKIDDSWYKYLLGPA